MISLPRRVVRYGASALHELHGIVTEYHMFLFLLAACINEDSFSTQAASTACSRAAECYKADFEKEYDDYGECVDDYVDRYDCYSDACDFDVRGAGDYLADLRTSDCPDMSKALFDLDDVYDDCDDFELAACLIGF